MYGGRIVELGPTAEVVAAPCHPYTSGLLQSLPSQAEPGTELVQITGAPPSLIDPPAGCAFAPRCPRADAVCEAMPDLSGGPRPVRCHHPLNVALREGVT